MLGITLYQHTANIEYKKIHQSCVKTIDVETFGDIWSVKCFKSFYSISIEDYIHASEFFFQVFLLELGSDGN